MTKPPPVRFVAVDNDVEDVWACGTCKRITGAGDSGRILADRCCPPRPCKTPGCSNETEAYDLCSECSSKRELKRYLAQLKKAKPVPQGQVPDTVPLLDIWQDKTHYDTDSFLDDLLEDIYGVDFSTTHVLIAPALFVMEEYVPKASVLVERLVELVCDDNDNDQYELHDSIVRDEAALRALEEAVADWLGSMPSWFQESTKEYVDIRDDVRERMAEEDDTRHLVEGVHWRFVGDDVDAAGDPE